MIYTLTLNPSLDYYMELNDSLDYEKTNRSELEYYLAGGKGVNVSIVLSNLGIQTKAFGFIGGYNKDFYLRLLEIYHNVEPSFVTVDGAIRLNVKVKGKQSFEINANGAYIEQSAKDQLFSRIKRLSSDDYLIISGNIQEQLRDYIEEIVQYLNEENINFILDTDAFSARRLIKYKPLLVKPNINEINDFFERDDIDENNAFEYAQKLKDLGCKYVIVSMGRKGSVMIGEEGKYQAHAFDRCEVHSCGAGDSMIAGFIFSLQRGFDEANAYKYSVCCALATTFANDLAVREKIESYFDEFDICTL